VSTVNLAASEQYRHAANTAISELFDPIADMSPLLESRPQIGLLRQLDPEFEAYYQNALPLTFRKVLAEQVQPGSFGEISLFDQREVSDLGGIAISDGFACWSKSATDKMRLNREFYATDVAISRYSAQGTMEFAAPCTALHRKFEFQQEDALVVVRAVRRRSHGGRVVEKKHSFSYGMGKGTLAFNMNVELLLSDKTDAEHADGFMQTFVGLLKVMQQAPKPEAQALL